jgi:hypothetical protein
MITQARFFLYDPGHEKEDDPGHVHLLPQRLGEETLPSYTAFCGKERMK